MSPSDGQLLERFAAQREESAFAQLVERHGPMVLGVCRRVLHDEHDAEDAFQAVFLVLARKSASIRKREALGSWLYGVAYRVAARLRSGVGLRRVKERQMSEMPSTERVGGDLIGTIVWRELRPMIDEELNHLPTKYRDPLVLCYLQGKTHDEAAQALGWSKGSMSRRKDKARELLRGRLSQRGITLSAGIILGVLMENAASAGVPAMLLHKTVQAASLYAAGKTVAAGVISAQAAALSQGVLQTMFMSKLKLTAAVILAMVVVGTGAGMTLNALAGPQTGGGAGGSGAGKPAAEQALPGTGSKAPTGSGGGPARDGAGTSDKAAHSASELRKLLTQPSDKLAKGFDANTPLRDVLEFVSDSFNVPIRIDYDAFGRQGFADAKNTFEDASIRLRPMKRGTLAQALRDILSQIDLSGDGTLNGRATYLVKGADIVVVPFSRIVPDDSEMYPNGTSVSKALREPVSVSVEERPLSDALRELADSAGANIIIDVRLKDKVKTPVTVVLQHVPLETAVRLMADMADVKAVALDNVMYITAKENAEKLALEQWNRTNGTGPAEPNVGGNLGGGGISGGFQFNGGAAALGGGLGGGGLGGGGVGGGFGGGGAPAPSGGAGAPMNPKPPGGSGTPKLPMGGGYPG